MERLKRVVIKEELVALTGKIDDAVVLNQFIYWSQRVKDFDKMIEEEKRIAEYNGSELKINYRTGWIRQT